MSSTPLRIGLRSRSVAVLFVMLTALAASTGSASAAVTANAYFDIGIYPAGLSFGSNQVPRPAGAYYDAGYSSAGPRVPRRVEQVRGGAVIPRTGAPVDIQVGDVFRVVTADTGQVLAQTTFDGSPALADTACIGQNGFSGRRAPDATVSVWKIGPPIPRSSSSYGTYEDRYRPGRVRSLGDGTFAGVFDTAIAAGEFLQASQTTETFTADTRTTVNTTVTRAAGGCPPPVPDTTAPPITSFELGFPGITIAQFLKYGLTSFVGVGEPGIVSQALYLDDGAKVPATAAKKKAKKKKKPKGKKKPTLIGSGRTTASVVGVVKVVVKPSKGARKALKGQRKAKLILLTSVKDAAGNVTTLKPKKLSLKAR